MSEKIPSAMGATFAERKAARLSAGKAAASPKAVTPAETEDKSIGSGETKGRASR